MKIIIRTLILITKMAIKTFNFFKIIINFILMKKSIKKQNNFKINK